MAQIRRAAAASLGTVHGLVMRRQGPVDEVLEDLEEALIAADVGVDTTMALVDRLGSRARSGDDLAGAARGRGLLLESAGLG